MNLRICGLVLTLTLATAAAPLDLRGVQLGMTLAQTKAALAGAGFLTTPRMFNSNWQPKDARLIRLAAYGRRDLEFDSSFAVVKRGQPNDWGGDLVVTVFTPPPSASRVWGIGQGSNYAPGSGPSAKTTVQALIKKYGQPSDSYNADFSVRAGVARLGWYLDASGRSLGQSVANTCKHTVHNTYMVNQTSKTQMRTPNVVVEKPDWFAGAVKLGCTVGVNAEMSFDMATGEISYIEIKVVDLANGYAAAQKTKLLVADQASGEVAAKRKQAEQRKVEF